MSTSRFRGVFVALSALLVGAACSGTQSPVVASPARPSSDDPVITQATVLSPAPPPASPDPLQASFSDLRSTIPAQVGIAVAAVGSSDVVSLGAWPADVAWSTIKVPLAIAALQASRAQAEPLVAAAVSKSDNVAAEQLWSMLGDPAEAKAAVEDILRLGGDATTVVQSQRVRPQFTAFGQTVWSLEDQTRFAAHLPCLGMAEADAVMTQMSISAQRWGIADDGAPAKGGWGPDEQGNYLVRQFGVMQTPAGQTAVSLAAYPADGSFDSGVAAVNRLADWLDAHRADLPSGTCAAG